METKQKATDWREVRRRRAWELKQQGWKQRDIAVALGVTEGAVSQWLKRAREQGCPGERGEHLCKFIDRHSDLDHSRRRCSGEDADRFSVLHGGFNPAAPG